MKSFKIRNGELNEGKMSKHMSNVQKGAQQL